MKDRSTYGYRTTLAQLEKNPEEGIVNSIICTVVTLSLEKEWNFLLEIEESPFLEQGEQLILTSTYNADGFYCLKVIPLCDILKGDIAKFDDITRNEKLLWLKQIIPLLPRFED